MARLRGCNLDPHESLHSGLTYRLHLEVLEDEKILPLRTARALATALQIGHPDFDLNSLATVIADLSQELDEGIPYLEEEAAEGGSAVEQERQAFVDRFKDIYTRAHKKDSVNENPAPPPEIKAVGKRDAESN